MTNDAAVDVEPVAWVERTEGGLTRMWSGDLSAWAHRPANPEPLYSATTVAELRAQITAYREADESMQEELARQVSRAEAAERRVAELEAGAHAVVLAFEALGQSRGIVADRAAHRQCEATLVTLKSLYALRQEKPE